MKKKFLKAGVFFLVGGFLVSCTAQKPVAKELPQIKGKKVLMIIASHNFRDEEYSIPRKILESAGATVICASSTLKPARGMLGMVVKPDILIEKVKPEDYDGFIFVGGVGASEYWGNPQVHSLIRKAVKMGKIVAAICIAPVTLAKAGVLKGKKATVWPSEKRELLKKGAIYTGKRVEVEKNIITADGPKSSSLFAEEIVKALSRKK